jgi:hypothetical protein
LIGGPNQSHKVNFKELPRGERVQARTSALPSSILIPDIFRKELRKEPEACLLVFISLPGSNRQPKKTREGGTWASAGGVQALFSSEIAYTTVIVAA